MHPSSVPIRYTRRHGIIDVARSPGNKASALPHVWRCRPEARGITIDGPTSRDLDDAIWLQPAADGAVLHVSIADVAAAIPIGGEVSLLPHQPRPAITVSIPILTRGALGTPRILRTTLTSHLRLTYAEADAALTDRDHPYQTMLHALSTLADHLLAQRRARGALALFDLAHGWRTTEEGSLRRMRPEEAHRSHLIVQECMILTNEVLARHFAQHSLPCLFRNHTATPAPTHAALLRDIEAALAHPVLLDLKQVRERVHLVLNKAAYGPTLEGHWGLNEPAYLHGTSPIRRLADLLDQRQLAAHL